MTMQMPLQLSRSSIQALFDETLAKSLDLFGDTDAASVEKLRRVMHESSGALAIQAEHMIEASNVQQARFDAAMNNLKLGMAIFDAQGELAMANERCTRLLGQDSISALIGLSMQEFCVEMLFRLGELATGHARIESLLALARSKESSSVNLIFESGKVLHFAYSPVPEGGFVLTLEDVTERRKAEAKASHLASYDVLTNLPNRRLLKQHIYVCLNDSQADCAVLCVALDRFKAVNDTLGHSGGDALLVEVSRRLRQCTREGDVVGRLGGDQFLILLANVDGAQDAEALADRVVRAIARPFDLLGQSIIVSASVGIALAPCDGEEPDRLIKSANMALFEAKREGRGIIRFFEPSLEAKALDRQSLEVDLRRAVVGKQFELHYQPVFAARQRKLIGFEALVRWNHPTRGRVSPLDFITIAEELGLITDLGDWIIDEACRTAATWPDDIVVAVNVSARQFVNHDLFTVVNEALARHKLPASRLEIEITESALMESGGEIAAVLQRLRKQGIGIAMDDFGTGYSSLAYLRKFHFSKVKIDRSFINGLATETQSIAIVRAIIALCKSLNILVTAEGVETEVQADILRLENCDYLQGFLLGRPVTTMDVWAFMPPPTNSVEDSTLSGLLTASN
jgi:diguanylate cyclase (GGDEF)-like protein/PAS domain S-box-containing protein